MSDYTYPPLVTLSHSCQHTHTPSKSESSSSQNHIHNFLRKSKPLPQDSHPCNSELPAAASIQPLVSGWAPTAAGWPPHSHGHAYVNASPSDSEASPSCTAPAHPPTSLCVPELDIGLALHLHHPLQPRPLGAVRRGWRLCCSHQANLIICKML